MKVMALGHVVLKVGNLDRSLAFYSQTLGLRMVARTIIRDMPMAFFSMVASLSIGSMANERLAVLSRLSAISTEEILFI